MVRIAELVKGKPITLRHERWLAANASPQWSVQALEFAEKVLRHEVGGARGKRRPMRASSMHDCERKHLYRALRTEGAQPSASLANIFATGNFLHLKWQMMGLTEGWLATAEVPVDDGGSFGGTMDGIVHDGSVFEFKSINSRGFGTVVRDGVKRDHLMQVHAYFRLSGRDRASVVYENKDNGDWVELVVHRQEEYDAMVAATMDSLQLHWDNRLLPEPLKPCLEKSGPDYRYCDFRDRCLAMHAEGSLWP